jgi:hypothetical protein
VSYRCADPKSFFGQIEGSIESRSVRSCQSRVLRGSKCSAFYINTIEYLPWLVPLCPPSHPCCWCSNMETRLEFLCSTSASWIMKDHFGYNNDYSSNQWSITGDVGRHYERWYTMCSLLCRNSWSRDFRVSYRCADPQNLLDKLKIASSRDPSGCRNQSRVLREASSTTFYINTISTMVDPTLPA